MDTNNNNNNNLWIEEWMKLDNQIAKITETLQTLKAQRKTIEEKILSEQQQLHPAIKIVQTKVPECLSFKYLDKHLKDLIVNEEQIQTIIQYLKDKREVKTVQEIKRAK